MFKKKNSRLKRDIESEFKEKDISKWESKAEDYIGSREKSEYLLNSAVRKAKKRKNGPISEVWEKINLLFDVFKDWTNGNYRQMPKGSIVAIIAAIAYFVSPFDIIPDWVISLGLIDDAVVIGYVVRQISSDLDKYREWKDSKIIQVNYKFDSSEMESE
jgi:uncharacterized membrane protein YkvA (DUF1232 family)